MSEKGEKPPKAYVCGCPSERTSYRFLMRLPLTQQVLYSSQVAPRAAQVRVHFHGLVEEGLLAVLVTGK